jgi:type II secretory pathway pseudopilin PulG
MIAKIKKQKRVIKIPSSVIAVVLLVGALGFLVFSNWNISQKRSVLKEQIEFLKNEIQTAESRRLKLEAGILDTEKDSYWEGKIREQGYKKEGEEQVVVLPPNGIEKNTVVEKNFWEKFLQKFGF